MVELGPEAITARLRELSRCLRARGFVDKGLDMSAPAVTTRLRVLAALSDMCRQLVKVGEPMRGAARSMKARGVVG